MIKQNREIQAIQRLINKEKKPNKNYLFNFLSILRRNWYIILIIFCLLFPKVPAKITYNVIEAFKTEHVKIFDTNGKT